MDNLHIYNQVKEVPEKAIKPIQAGRLKGMSDINPVWRIKKLTEIFGACGIGWYYDILDKRLEKGGKDEIAAFVDVNLFYKWEGEWSKPIPGTGGNMFVASEKNGLHTSDECFKMALTDAISVASKAIGIGADVYWNADKTKYGKEEPKVEQFDKDKVIKQVWGMLLALNSQDEEMAKAALEVFTSYTDKQGHEVKGVKTFTGMSDKMLQVTYGKVKVAYLKMKEGVV